MPSSWHHRWRSNFRKLATNKWRSINQNKTNSRLVSFILNIVILLHIIPWKNSVPYIYGIDKLNKRRRNTRAHKKRQCIGVAQAYGFEIVLSLYSSTLKMVQHFKKETKWKVSSSFLFVCGSRTLHPQAKRAKIMPSVQLGD